MPRIGDLSIVLMLAAGQTLGLPFHVLCVPHEAATMECQHGDPSPVVAGDDSCERTVSATVALAREDPRRGSSAPDGQQGAILPGFRFALSPSDVDAALDRAHQAPLGARRLPIALRL